MAIRWNNAGSINWPHLNRRLIDSWERKASSATGVDRFVNAFIVLNHYYSGWAVANGQHFHSERLEAMHLADLPVLANWWTHFVKLHDVKGRSIPLPLMDRNNHAQPPGLAAGDYEAAQLAPAQWINVVYQLRCDFFHASRGPTGHQNERMVRFVADPVFELVKYLGMNTTPQ